MSIVTKTGDHGTTALMYNRRVSKCHPRVEAYGALDELNAALGLARAASSHDFVRNNVLAVQKDLIVIMGELATDPQDQPRYVKDGFSLTRPEMTTRLESLVVEIESQKLAIRHWALPGANLPAAGLDLARTTCRRAERHACSLQEGGQLHNPEILIYLNRLSDLLWLLARWAEVN